MEEEASWSGALDPVTLFYGRQNPWRHILEGGVADANSKIRQRAVSARQKKLLFQIHTRSPGPEPAGYLCTSQPRPARFSNLTPFAQEESTP
ncbi:hypothetical protein AMELA_G00069460 [Ameiurus melas]|uniref:Uncharacterized protein n=1 Tax=Ameiurus melas TaxID=219545 RepID=A0A7J6B3E3_AMEME|nr:hypothetical protein AMELA_G00069460 [Ameiurus melas]